MGQTPQHQSSGQPWAGIQPVDARDDPTEVNRVRSTVYEMQQHFRYCYPAPIRDLTQRLVVVPRPVHGDQRVLTHRLEVSQPHSREPIRVDEFGNVIHQVSVPTVEAVVEFDISLRVERCTGQGPHFEATTAQALNSYRLPSDLTQPDAALRAVADELGRSGETGSDLARTVGGWVYRRMSFGFDRTGVRTTACEALAAGHGVCQDYAHLMIALCRMLGLPVRYVSGHLVGEGGTHAWVEVLLPAPTPGVEIFAWDPTHDRPADLRYLTIAVGRDYHDVAPVCGTYSGAYTGRLTTARRVSVAPVGRQIAA